MATGILDVTVVSAALTRIEDPGDTYVLVKCGYEQFQTHTVTDHSSSRTWNKTSTLNLQGENKNNNIVVELYGRRQQSQELLGLVRISLSKALSTTGTSVYTLTRPDLGESGQIKIAFHWESTAAQVLEHQEVNSASTGKGQSNAGSLYSTAPTAPAFPESGNYDFSSYTTPETLRPIKKSSVDSATAAFAGLDIGSNVHGEHFWQSTSNEAGTYPGQTSGHPTYSDPSAKYYGIRSTDEAKPYPTPSSTSGSTVDYRPPPSPYPPITSTVAEVVAPYPTQSPYPPPPYPLPSDSTSDLAARHPPPPSTYPSLAATSTQPGAPYSQGAPTHPGYPPKEFQTTPKGGNREDSNAAALPYESTYPPTVAQSNYPHADSKVPNHDYAYPTPINHPPAPYGQHNVNDTTERGTKLTQDRGKNSSYGYQPGGYPPPAPYPQGYPPAGYPPAGYPPPQVAGYPPSGFPGYPPSGYPPAPYPQPGYAPQYPSYPPAPYPSAHGYHAAPSHSSHGLDLGYMGGAPAAYGGYALHGHGHGHEQHHGHGHGHHGHGHVKHHKQHHHGHPVHYGHGHHYKHKHHKFFGKWK